MWLVNLVFVAVAVCLLQTCHGDVQVNGPRVGLRFLGNLNRYYAYSWDLGNGAEYIDLHNTANAINDLGLGGDENVTPEDTTPNPTTANPEDTTPNPEGTTPNPEGTTPNPTTANPEDTTPNPEGTTPNPEGTTPNPEGTTPNPTTANPEQTTPNPEGTTPNPTTANPEDTTPNPNVREAKTKDFVIVIHGRNDSAFGNFGQTLKKSFVSSDHDLIVIVVDWSLIANRDYTTAFNAASFIAEDIRTLIRHLQAAIKTVHIIGFDIGAHIAGIISRHSSVKVQRITGLSPAGQNWGANSHRLRPTDAEYVEVIHTDYTGARAFGIGVIVGTVDMYANTGTNQPGCANANNLCHHNRAWQLFAASLDFGGHLVGLGCNSITDMTRNRCANPPGVTLGTNALSKRGTGIYRVNTGRAYPYTA